MRLSEIQEQFYKRTNVSMIPKGRAYNKKEHQDFIDRWNKFIDKAVKQFLRSRS